jgi:hypothetical protein
MRALTFVTLAALAVDDSIYHKADDTRISCDTTMGPGGTAFIQARKVLKSTSILVLHMLVKNGLA